MQTPGGPPWSPPRHPPLLLNLGGQKAPAGRLSKSKYNLIRPKGTCGTLFHLKIQLDPPKRSLRDAFPSQNTILSSQRAPVGRFSDSKYNFIRPKGPCGTLFRLKIQFYPPKKAPAGRFSTPNSNFIRQKGPAGRISSAKYNLIRPKGPCETTFCYS